jgi:predicted metal-binding membrane protein
MIGLLKTKAFALFSRAQILLGVIYNKSQWSLWAIAMIAPLSLLALWIWSTTPNLPAPSHGLRPLGMDDFTWFLVFLVGWILMTAAMMLPSAMPLFIALDRVARGQHNRHHIPFIAALAYFGIWGLVGMALWIANVAAETLMIHCLGAEVKAGLAGTGLILAGLYSLSPFANSCLHACQRPFGFLARYWQGSHKARQQAALIGAAYGLSCVGCCISMIAMMFVVGMGHMAIIIAMGVVMAMMKSSSSRTWVAKFLAMTLIVTGIWIGISGVPLSPHHH